MTKSRQSASRPKLSRLFRWLAVLCFIKLTIFGLLLCDVPLPFVNDDSKDAQPVAENSAAPKPAVQTPAASGVSDAKSATAEQNTADKAAGDKVAGEKAVELALQHALRDSQPGRLPNVTDVVDNASLSSVAPLPEAHEPQGKSAARLAAKKQPATPKEQPTPALPTAKNAAQTDVQTAAGTSAIAIDVDEQPAFRPGDIPLPAPLAAPVAEPGVAAPHVPNSPDAVMSSDNEGVWDMLGLTKLPIPTLGSVKTAHAAAQSMPLPQTAPASSASPFAPQEQRAPIVMPGAPDIPANIPTGQSLGDTPPLRPMGTNTAVPSGAMPATPSGQPAGAKGGGNLYDAQELARQQQDVLMLKQQMDDRLKELRTSEQKVQKMLQEAKGLEDKKLKGLILMYVNMKPKNAAQAIEKMDERVAAQILRGMTPKQSGEILSYTNPNVTAKLTELLSRVQVQ